MFPGSFIFFMQQHIPVSHLTFNNCF